MFISDASKGAISGATSRLTASPIHAQLVSNGHGHLDLAAAKPWQNRQKSRER
jgi:hypothetical protein